MRIGNKNGVKHGEHGTSLYKKWKSMRGRVASHSHYIAHNIKCCSEWDNYVVFKEWAVANGYDDSLSLDRKDTFGNYTPYNCRWVSKTVQSENAQKRKDNSSGYRGVSFDKESKKYKVQIQVNKKKVYLGRYETAIEGAIAFDTYVKAIGTDHALNFKE